MSELIRGFALFSAFTDGKSKTTTQREGRLVAEYFSKQPDKHSNTVFNFASVSWVESREQNADGEWSVEGVGAGPLWPITEQEKHVYCYVSRMRNIKMIPPQIYLFCLNYGITN